MAKVIPAATLLKATKVQQFHKPLRFFNYVAYIIISLIIFATIGTPVILNQNLPDDVFGEGIKLILVAGCAFMSFFVPFSIMKTIINEHNEKVLENEGNRFIAEATKLAKAANELNPRYVLFKVSPAFAIIFKQELYKNVRRKKWKRKQLTHNIFSDYYCNYEGSSTSFVTDKTGKKLERSLQVSLLSRTEYLITLYTPI